LTRRRACPLPAQQRHGPGTDAAEADAAATAAFVLGAERGIAFLRSRPGVRGVIVDAGGALHWSDETLERMAHR